MEARKAHEPGECPDSYGNDVQKDGSYLCDGVETLGTDPFAEEIYGDMTEYWQCTGVNTGSAMDI